MCVSFSWRAGSEICFFPSFFNINHFLSSLSSLLTSVFDNEFYYEKSTCNYTTIDLEITFSTFSFSFLAHFLHCSLSSNFSCSIIPWDELSPCRTDNHSVSELQISLAELLRFTITTINFRKEIFQ